MRRVASAAAVAAILGAAPAAAHAVDRPIQAYDQPTGFVPVWTPSQITAQPGDTITWSFDETGNPNGQGSHDVHLVPPGQPDQRLGATYLGLHVSTTVTDEGTYSFYCSIHPDSMRGTITVAAGAPTPVIDPGRPWESTAPPIVVDTGGPTPLLNPVTPPVLLETGDTIAPTLKVLKVSAKRRTASARVSLSEAGVVYARVLRGKRVVKSAHLSVKPGTSSVSVKLPKRHASYRLSVFARDFSGLQSKTFTKSLRG